MKKKDLIFCIGVIASVILIQKALRLFIFPYLELGIHAKPLRTVISGLIVIAACTIFAKRRGLLAAGGFIQPNWKNFSLLTLPLFFPGALFVSGLALHCVDSIEILVVTVSAILIAAVLEEVIFRGVIQGYLIASSPFRSPHTVCLITAVLFSLLHLVNLEYYELSGVLQQVVCAFYVGLLFSALLLRTKSVWMLGLVHGMVNFLSFRCEPTQVVPDDVSGQSSLLNPADLVNILLAAVLFSPILIIYWFLLRPLKLKKPPAPSS